MAKPKTLVTSASGNTGFQTARQLLEQGFPVRALVRRTDERSNALLALGADIQVGNLHDIDDVRCALNDVQRAYFCAPLLPDALSASVVFAAAAQDHRLEVVVALSQWLADPRHPSIHTRETWLADKMFSWMPNVDLVTINPGWFADNYMAALEPIAQFGMMPMPLGDGMNAPPSNEDIARVIVGALVNPARHIGKIYRPTGPALLSPQDIAATYAKVLDRPVRYFDAPAGLFTKVARALNFPDFTTAQVLWYFEDYKRNAFAIGAPTQAVLEVTGQAPEDFETIVRRYVAKSPWAKKGLGPMLRAMGGMMKVMLQPTIDPARYAQFHHFPKLTGASLAVESEKWLSTHTSNPGLLADKSAATPSA